MSTPTTPADDREAFEAWYDAQPSGKLNPWDVYQAGIRRAVSAGHACVFALDGGGNIYRRYSEPQCAAQRQQEAAPAAPASDARAESYEDLANALQSIDTAAAFLPNYVVRHEGGIEAFTQNIIDAITPSFKDDPLAELLNHIEDVMDQYPELNGKIDPRLWNAVTIRFAEISAPKASVQPVAWMRRDGAKAMPATEKLAWIEAGKAGVVEDYTIALYDHLLSPAATAEPKENTK